MQLAEAEWWIRAHVEPIGPIEKTYEKAWSTVLRVPLADRVVWFKACGPVQAFEPRLEAELSARWPGRVGEVLAYDEKRAWLLLADAGSPVGFDSPPETWLQVLPRYAELQRGETAHLHEHLAHDVQDLRVAALPARYEDFLQHELPIDDEEIEALRGFAPRFAELCTELAAHGIPETIQHDDLHGMNVYALGGDELRVLDWGDASVGHPFASLVVTFRFLEGINKLPPNDPWFARLRDAYLEPWGPGLTETCALAIRVGTFAHSIAWARQRDHLPEADRADFDPHYADLLRRAIGLITSPS